MTNKTKNAAKRGTKSLPHSSDLPPATATPNSGSPSPSGTPIRFSVPAQPNAAMVAAPTQIVPAALMSDEERQEKFEQEKNQLLESGDVVGYLQRFDGHERQAPFFKVHSRLSNRQYWDMMRFVWNGE